VAALESAESDGSLMLSCRTGPLRVERSLRDLYTGRGDQELRGASRCSALADSKLGLDAI
jgi:hypothetical protein